ncbi:MAG: ABC transporter ATP-binding protein [Rickettsiaceae bacterium]|nr:ABC transporter ATP-binding protein [Rickettsiaceae bacterium]
MVLAIDINNLSKNYSSSSGSKLALDHLNLAIPQGTVFGLLGPNGAGKSTLINIIAGTVVKSSGNVNIMGVNIDDRPKLASSLIGIVPQEIVIDSFFSLYQLLEFTAGYYGIRPKNRKTKEILQALSLYDKRNNSARELSGGMRRRALIAKAMVHSPKVLILDEPTAGVDIELRDELFFYVKKLNKQGTTIIITTHYLAEAEELCSNIAFINHGKIIKTGKKDDLLQELSSRHLEVEFEEKLNKDRLKFKAKNKYEILGEHKIRFELANEDNCFNSLINDINSTGLTIKDLQSIPQNLEDVFHKIVN